VGDSPSPRRRVRADGDEGFPQCPPPDLDWAWPALWAFLAQGRWEDGTQRTPGTVTLFYEQGRLKVCLNDKDSGDVGFCSLLEGGHPLDELERLLVADHIDWRAPRRPQGRK